MVLLFGSPRADSALPRSRLQALTADMSQATWAARLACGMSLTTFETPHRELHTLSCPPQNSTLKKTSRLGILFQNATRHGQCLEQERILKRLLPQLLKTASHREVPACTGRQNGHHKTNQPALRSALRRSRQAPAPNTLMQRCRATHARLKMQPPSACLNAFCTAGALCETVPSTEI